VKSLPIYGLYGLLLVAVIGWLSSFLGGEEGRVRKEVGQLEELLEKGPDEGPLASAQRCRRLAKLFARSFNLDLGSRGGTLRDHRRLSRLALGYREQFERIEVSFRQVKVLFDPSGSAAEVEFQAHLKGMRAGGPVRESYRLALRYVQEDSEWRIERAQILDDGTG
jgi:hypothetical protein